MQNVFFQVIFLIVNFFIFIGENTQKILLFPLVFSKAIIKFLTKKKSEKKYSPLKKSKLIRIYFWRLKTFKVLPHVFQTIVKVFLFCIKAIGEYLLVLVNFLAKIFWKLFKFLIVNPFNSISLKVKFFTLGFVICLLVFFFNNAYIFVKSLPSPTSIGKVNYPLSSHIYDRNGKLVYEIYRDQNRTPIKLKELPNYISLATVAIEDKDFYRHYGISPISGILRAIKETLLYKKIQGGSTITQQLVKSALLTPEQTIERKVREMILALWTERLYSKDQIMEMYLNQVPYGGSSYGIEEAAKNYFGKSAKDLSISEAALLAGLPQAPSVYSPYINPQLTINRRNEVLQKMYEQGFIEKKIKESAQKEELNIILPKTTIRAPHFVFYLKSELEKQYGIKKVEEGGFKITSSIDLNLQEKVEEILSEEIEKVRNLNVGNGAVLVTKPATGEILAMVGSTDYFAQPYGAFNVTTALQQPGSSIKPIMYSLALDKGFTAASVVDDVPVVFTAAGAEAYRPVNYDGKFHGKVTIRYALANSYNIPAVRVLNTVGVTDFISYAKKLGISTWNDPSRYGLSLTLGGGEVKMTDMAVAFGVLANYGNKVNLNGVLNMETFSDIISYPNSILAKQVINPEIAFIISDILADNQARQLAFGPSSQLEIKDYKVAVKTGTTDNKKDNWTIGYTPEFLVVVWVGNNDGQPMNQYLASGVTGAAPIWHRVMEHLLTNYSTEKKWFDKPENIVEKNCYFNKKEYFVSGTEETASCRENLFKVSPSPTP